MGCHLWSSTESDTTEASQQQQQQQHLGGEQQRKGILANCSATWLAVSGFMLMGLVSLLSLANHSDSEPFLVVQALLSQDGCQREGFWEAVGHVLFPFDLS